MNCRRRFIALIASVAAGGAAASLASFDVFQSKNPQDLEPERRIIADVPKDAIPPLDSPRYVKAREAPWLRDEDVVLGYENNGDARAYPILLMNWHEIVNDTIGGRRVLITYCPLTYTGMVFDPRVGTNTLSFGNTGALFESNLVLYDRQTESYWWQVGGEAIKGPLKGSGMKLLPSLTATWSVWQNLYPETLVLSRETGYIRAYHSNPYAAYNVSGGPASPVSVSDDRLPAKAIVLGLEQDGKGRAYPLSTLGLNIIADQVAGARIVVYSNPNKNILVAFEPFVDGRELRFKATADGFIDEETKSTWGITGRAIDGPLTGRRLVQVPALVGFWFAWVTVHPKTELGLAS